VFRSLSTYFIYLGVMSVNGICESYFFATFVVADQIRYTFLGVPIALAQSVIAAISMQYIGVSGLIVGNIFGM